jgi:hypothetical protein
MPTVIAMFVFIAALTTSEAQAQAQTEMTSEAPGTDRSDEPSSGSEAAGVPGAEELAPLDDQAHLDKWLVYLSRNAKRARLTTGASSLVGSGIVMGLGIWAYLQDVPDNELTKGAGLVALAGSGVFMSLGIFQLAKKSELEKTLERWRTAKAGELTSKELARFEGELRQYSESAERAVRIGRWTNFGMALTGALVVGLTPAADLSSDGATVGYVTGGAALGVGLLGFALSFVGQSDPGYWSSYLQGKSPPSPSRWSASPQVGRTFAGLGVRGRF